jgi:hypothetical protein
MGRDYFTEFILSLVEGVATTNTPLDKPGVKNSLRRLQLLA